MDTFPIIFPAPSPALVELTRTSESTVGVFAKAWQREAVIPFNGFRVMPSRSLCQLYYDFIRGRVSLKAYRVHDTEGARRHCSVDSSKERDWATLPSRLISAGLR